MTASPGRGTGLLALFCDLNPEWRAEFRQWLLDDMFPARLAIGFRACASYDLLPEREVTDERAQSFVTLYETQVTGDLYAAPYRGLRHNRDARDRAFHARFQNLDRYVLTWMGPEIGDPPPELAPCVHIERFDLAPEAVPAFNAWFVDRYLPGCAEIDGLVRVRRFLAVEGRFANLLLHEFTHEDTLSHEAWMRLRADDVWALAMPRACASYRRVIERHAVTAGP